ncbi:hypothetical protein AADZ90_021495 [Aestuariibius sp. 2305UL40-4]|uniref:hypothetical protein n=1 Tax=Aestuariibius violaceus TaxID=3234132 RepID=UPI0034723CA8
MIIPMHDFAESVVPLRPLDESSTLIPAPYVLEGRRLILSAVEVCSTPDDNLKRMDADANIEDVSLLHDLHQDHPLRLGLALARSCARLFLRVAVKAADEDGLHLRRCLCLRVAVQTSPTFFRTGLFAAASANVMQEVFGTENTPTATAIGVASLPMNGLVSIDGEFVLS